MRSGPNPREISNIVVAQDTGEDGPYLIDDNGIALSGMIFAWGQFIDHDLDLQREWGQLRISRSQFRLVMSFCSPAAPFR